MRRKGTLHQYESDGNPTRPILDHELASAIESLQSSTATIEEQCKILEAQKATLLKLKALDKPNLNVEHARNERRRKEGQEKVRLDVAVCITNPHEKLFTDMPYQIDDISTYIGDQLAECQKELDMDKTSLSDYLADRFSSDDQILSRLPGLVAKIVIEPDGSDDEKSIDQWCKAIVSFRTGEIKARVDTVFLSSLANGGKNGHAGASEADLLERKTALQAEMEDLHSEIASVAEMVVEHEMRKPMNEIKERRDRDILQARGAWLNYVRMIDIVLTLRTD